MVECNRCFIIGICDAGGGEAPDVLLGLVWLLPVWNSLPRLVEDADTRLNEAAGAAVTAAADVVFVGDTCSASGWNMKDAGHEG